jgi:preprotein translocase subunit SecB
MSNYIAQLNPKSIWAEKINIKLASETNESEMDDYLISVTPSYSIREDKKAYKGSLRFRMHPKITGKCTYDMIDVTAVGIFEFIEGSTEDQIRMLMPLNMYVMLLGFIRGVIAQITGMNPGGVVMIPGINMLEAVKNRRSPRMPDTQQETPRNSVQKLSKKNSKQ